MYDYFQYEFTVDVVEKALPKFVSWQPLLYLMQNQGTVKLELPSFFEPAGICDPDAIVSYVENRINDPEIHGGNVLGCVDCNIIDSNIHYETSNQDAFYQEFPNFQEAQGCE